MKRIIVCCDGTWNKPGITDRGSIVQTNVEKIYDAIDNGNDLPVKQVKFYGRGVGTGFSRRDQILGGGTGLGIDRNIQDAYKFIMWNYVPGDEVYLFGFSRGAYTVRSLGGLIRNCGMMKPEFLHLVNEAYQLYRDRTSLTHPDSDLMKAFKRSYGIDEGETKVTFIGVWDTVGALGVPLRWFNGLNKKYEFHDVKLSSQIKYAYHALAVDERRKIFEPALWELAENGSKSADPQVCEQVWFPGVHSNVGGGYADSGLSDIALKWMISKANDAGLQFDKNYIEKLKPDCCGELRNSAAGIFAITPKQVREINNSFVKRADPVSGKTTDVKVIRNEYLHYTCFERCHKQKVYKPTNVQQALGRETPFDPLKDKWEKEWLDYLNEWVDSKLS